MIYEHSNYKSFLESEIAARGLSLREVCEATGIQPPYLTKVFKHDAHLTEEQIFQLALYLGLSDDEQEFLFLLLRYAKTSARTFRQNLSEKIKLFREKKLQFSQFDDSSSIPQTDSESMRLIEFFLSPNQQTIFKALRIPKYRNNPYLLCQKLEILESEVDDTLIRLDRLRLISRNGSQISIVGPEPRLRESHALIAHHHKNWRIESLKRHFPKQNENLKISVSIATNLKSQHAFKAKLQKLVDEFVEEGAKDQPTQVVQLNIDLFAIC